MGVFALDTPLLLTCAGFLILMAVQAFIFGNATALDAAEAPHIAVTPPPSSASPKQWRWQPPPLSPALAAPPPPYP